MKHHCRGRDPRKYADGSGMTALAPIDLNEIGSFDGMLRAMEKTSFGGRRVGEAADVLHQMVTDRECFKVATLSGAMTPAQMGLIICDLIDVLGFDCLVSTGALMTHGLVQGNGGTHFKVPEGTDDQELFEIGANRIYDTIELESNLDKAEKVMNEILRKASPRKIWSSWAVSRALGEYLDRHTPRETRAIFKSAFRKNVPIFIPAFTDSELGLDLCIHRYAQGIKGRRPLRFDPFLDLEKYTSVVSAAVKQGKSLGIFTIGGGVPRNWAQQVGPHLDIRGMRLGPKHGLVVQFKYGIRICTAPETDGGLSGCTYKEGVSWGKFVHPHRGGRQAEVIADATMVLPLIVKGVMERMGVK